MPTFTVTREVGAVLRHLKNGGAVCKVWNGKYAMCQPTGDHRGNLEIADETFEELRKAKLLRKYDYSTDPHRWYVSWYQRSKTWLVSDTGKEFHLPPETLWVPDEHLQQSS